jgi:hypothetical protein
MGDHLLGKEYPVVDIRRVKGRTVYELDISPAQWWRTKRVYPFGANEVTVISGKAS